MDVNTTIRQLIAALLEGDRSDASCLAEDLVCWLDKGGYFPSRREIILILEDLLNRYSD